MAVNEISLGQFLVKGETWTTFILKEDGRVYLRSTDGSEEGPITVKQFMQGMDAINNMLEEWRAEVNSK